MASDEVTLEAWVQPADDAQSLSRVIATFAPLSAGLVEDRTYQDGEKYQLHVRTRDWSVRAFGSTKQPQYVVNRHDSSSH